MRIPLIVTDDSDIVPGRSGDRDRRFEQAGHIGHRPDNIGRNAGVDIEAELLPVGAMETARGLVFAL